MSQNLSQLIKSVRQNDSQFGQKMHLGEISWQISELSFSCDFTDFFLCDSPRDQTPGMDFKHMGSNNVESRKYVCMYSRV